MFVDDKGFLSLIDGLLAIFIIFIAIIAFNMIVDMEIPSLSEESADFKTSQDVMELMSMMLMVRIILFLKKFLILYPNQIIIKLLNEKLEKF